MVPVVTIHQKITCFVSIFGAVKINGTPRLSPERCRRFRGMREHEFSLEPEHASTSFGSNRHSSMHNISDCQLQIRSSLIYRCRRRLQQLALHRLHQRRRRLRHVGVARALQPQLPVGRPRVPPPR